MEVNITNQTSTKQCHGFPIPQLWTVLAIGAFGLFFNTTSVFHIMKNFMLKKSILQVLLIDSIICIVSSFILIVVAAIFLAFPTNKVCGQLTCYLMQLAVLVPFWLGHTFVFQIAFHRNIVAAANTKQNQPIIKQRQHCHKICITTLSIIYLTIVLLLIGFDGIVHQVINDLHTYCISSYIFCGNYSYSFLNFEFVANLKNAELFKEGNYSRAEDHFSTSKFYCFG